MAKSTRGPTDIGSHLGQLYKEYRKQRFAVLNFVIAKDGKGSVALPRTESRDGIDMLSRIYTFVYNENTLYRGKAAIKTPVISYLPSPKPLKVKPVKQARSYSTVTRTGMEAAGRVGLALKSFLKFL